MNKKSRLILMAASVLISTTTLAAPARLALWETSQTRTETVTYKALEATTADGAAALYAKLREAALRVCRESSPFGVNDPVGLDACVGDALDAAVRRVGIPLVSVLHLQAGPSVTVAAR